MSVFGGRIAASFIGIFVIPGLYVVFQTLREKAHALAGTPITDLVPPGERMSETTAPARASPPAAH